MVIFYNINLTLKLKSSLTLNLKHHVDHKSAQSVRVQPSSVLAFYSYSVVVPAHHLEFVGNNVHPMFTVLLQSAPADSCRLTSSLPGP